MGGWDKPGAKDKDSSDSLSLGFWLFVSSLQFSSAVFTLSENFDQYDRLVLIIFWGNSRGACVDDPGEPATCGGARVDLGGVEPGPGSCDR